MSKSKHFLMISRFYYPYFQGGGPVKSTKNFIEFHKDYFSVSLLTSKKSLNGSKNIDEKFSSVKYLSLFSFCFELVKQIYFKSKIDVIYINSFFNLFSCLAIIISSFSNRKIFLHSRGVMKSNQIRSKQFKKILYIRFISFFTKKIIFLVNENDEEKVIRKYFVNSQIKYTFNYVEKPRAKITKSNKKFLFFSRISPEKGLLFLLECINEFNLNIELDIYGNIWDEEYFKRCMSIISTKKLVKYKGIIDPNKLDSLVSNYHCMILPTRGENFGHVIYESLKNSVPVLSTNFIPWKLTKNNCGKNIDLNKEVFSTEIKIFMNIDNNSYKKIKENALKYSQYYYENQSKFIINSNNECYSKNTF